MKIISPNVELIRQEPGLEGIFKQIERAGRTCYKSEDKIDEHSARVFVENLLKLGHNAMLEHGTVYLTLTINNEFRNKPVHYPWYMFDSKIQYNEIYSYVQYLFMRNKYSVVKVIENKDYNGATMCITTNYRVIVENGWQEIMYDFLSEPTIHHERRISLKFTTNIGVTRECNRHRVNSIAEESTRYCNYSKEKFGNEITFTAPSWLSREQLGNHDTSTIIMQTEELLDCGNYKDEELAELIYLNSCARAEEDYLKLIELGWKPQQAREVLPLATKSEVVYTAFAHDWKHWFDLRLYGTTGKPHPNMYEIAKKAAEILSEEEVIECDCSLFDLIYPLQEPKIAPENN